MTNYQPMIKFLRKIRQKTLTKNKLSKYLLYAIGEIILVVIGILIALNINLKSEQEKKEAKIEAVFENILNDLASEISETNYTINIQQKVDSLSYKVLNNKLSKKDYLNHDYRYLFNLDNDFWVFKFTQQAYTSLLQNIDEVPKKYNEVVKDLGELYNTNKKSIEYSNKEIIRLAAKNLDNLTDNFDWYANPKLKDLEIDYRLNNFRYKNSIKRFVAQKNNLLRHVVSYRKKAIELYKKIAILLNKTSINESFKIDYEAASILEGTWKLVDATIPIPDAVFNSKLYINIQDEKIISHVDLDTLNKKEDIIVSVKKQKFKTIMRTFNLDFLGYQTLTIKGDTIISSVNEDRLTMVKINKKD